MEKRDQRGDVEGAERKRRRTDPSTSLRIKVRPYTSLHTSHRPCYLRTFPLRSAVEEKAVKGDGFGLEGVELDLGELAFLDFAPAVHAGLSFLGFAAV